MNTGTGNKQTHVRPASVWASVLTSCMCVYSSSVCAFIIKAVANQSRHRAQHSAREWCQMSCLSKSFYPAAAIIKVRVCVQRPCVFLSACWLFVCCSAYIVKVSVGDLAAWKMEDNIRSCGVVFISRQPGDSPPDRGRDQAGRSPSSCSGDTFGPTRCLGVGHSEQSRGRRSSHCISSPGSLIPVGKTEEMLQLNLRLMN